MDAHTEAATDELRRKLRRIYPLLAARLPKHFFVAPTTKLRWDNARSVITVRVNESTDSIPLHELPTADLLHVIDQLPLFIDQVLLYERSLRREVESANERAERIIRLLE